MVGVAVVININAATSAVPRENGFVDMAFSFTPEQLPGPNLAQL
jgi:hypothetical protein